MSRTDKTDPYYVKLHREGVEQHDHRHGVCDFDRDFYKHDHDSLSRWRNNCGLQQSYKNYYDDGWFSQPKAVRQESKQQNRNDRRRVRQDIAHGRYDDLVKQQTGRNNANWVCY